MDFVNITPEVEAAVRKSGVREGLCLVNAMHITASVFITTMSRDCTQITRSGWRNWPRLIRRHSGISTTARAEDNADAHHKRQIMGREVVVAITAGKLDFGPWEQIFYGEFDGRRPKRVLIKVIGE